MGSSPVTLIEPIVSMPWTSVEIDRSLERGIPVPTVNAPSSAIVRSAAMSTKDSGSMRRPVWP